MVMTQKKSISKMEGLAKSFAIKAHGDQRYGNHSYSYHLEQVVSNAKQYTDDPYVLAAAWLHDTIEDTDVDFYNVFENFGRRISRLVFSVTNEPGVNRKERAAKTYPKIMAAGRDAVLIKLCDRIANVEHSIAHNHSMFKMYKKEYPKFRAALKLPGELKEAWARLDLLLEHSVEE